MSRRDAVLLLVLGAVWGSVYPLISVALRELTPSAVITVRTGLSALVLVPVAVRQGALSIVRTRPGAVLAAALLQATIPLILLTIGQQHVAAGLAGILVSSQPVWAAVLTASLDRAVHLRQSIGVLLGLLGVVLLFLRDLNAVGTNGLAGLAVLLAAILFAVGAVWIERVIPEIPPVMTAASAMTVSALALAPFTVLNRPEIPDLSTMGWMLVLGLVSTGGALVLFYTLIHRIGVVRANLAGYLAPGFAVGFGVAFLGETVGVTTVTGLMFILVGSFIASTLSVAR